MRRPVNFELLKNAFRKIADTAQERMPAILHLMQLLASERYDYG
jgi:hypothetical protein